MSGDGGTIFGNFIGTDGSSATNLGNAGDGILLIAASNVLIGDGSNNTNDPPNVIRDNALDGIQVFGDSTSIAILENSIYNNGGLGIDRDGGPSAPVLTWNSSTGQLRIQINGVAGASYRVELFSNQSPDPSGNGEGQTFIGYVTVTVDSFGYGEAYVTPSVLDTWLSATATNTGTNDTSEFSNAVFDHLSGPPGGPPPGP